MTSIKRAPPSHTGPLTNREIEVLRLLATGASNREMADQLVIALGTVKKHMNNICVKLRASNRVQAIARAQALRLL
jgi:ATP/maltotriose-dependent transcriptional regulator MalT